MTADKYHIAFVDDANQIHAYTARGECCNNVCFQHVSGVNVFDQPALVTAVETSKWEYYGDTEYDDNDETDQCFVTIKTLRGQVDIDMRNGHYTGRVEANTGITSQDEFHILVDDV